ncbi:uncharacterized protein [Choristoneura fumiferana]|uniref:uncharacterized protein n=1 Tax=Choristoneura fumiferana TaxID=7141 RepID=UPI003D156D96
MRLEREIEFNPERQHVQYGLHILSEEGPCPWHLCSQLCIPKHAHNHTCKCIEGYKHRQLPDNTWTCEAVGEKAQVVVAINGSLRAWELTKRERDARVLYENHEEDSAEITSVAVGWVNSSWMVWWADSEGRLRRWTPRPRCGPTPMQACCRRSLSCWCVYR